MGLQNSSATRLRRRSLGTAAALLAVGSMFLAACGSKSSSTTTAAPVTTAAPTETTAAPTETTMAPTETTAAPTETTVVTPPTGDPINVWVESTVDSSVQSYPNIKAAGEIYEKYINDNGGIVGRPLKVTFCDGKTDPNEDAACARKAVADGAVALVGGYDTDESLLIGVLEEANTAWFGACCPVVAKEFSSKVAFNMGSVFSFNPGAAARVVADGCKISTFIVGDNATGEYFKSQAKTALQKLGYTGKVNYVTLPLNTTDYSAIAAKATDGGVDCIHGFMGDIQWLGLIPAMQALGVKPRLYGPQGNLNGKVAEAFPDATEGAVVIGTYPNIDNAVWDKYRAALKKYNAPDLDWNSLAGLGTWAAFEGFRIIVEKMVADGVTTIDHTTFLAAANATTALDTHGMVGVIDFTKEWSGEGGAFPRIFNRNVFYDCISGGKLAPCAVPGPVDMTPYHA